jgi:mannose-6-phosphate isomerase
MKLYPIKFTPLFYYRIWGGDKLKTILNKKYREDSIGESWEISDVDGYETRVANGDLKGYTLKELIKQFKGDFVGDQVYKRFKDNFPLLIKFIDAKTPLSIQVHPNNLLAMKRHNSFGKNEMWYIMDAEKEAELIVGFNKDVEKEKYIEHLNSSTLNEILNIEKIKKGDTFYIPTGRVHAIGAGVLLAEIQQTSDITYRIYDYDRIDIKTEQKRELHTDLALDAIDFKYYDNYKTKYENKENTSNKLVYSQYFRTNIINISSAIKKDYSNIDSFVIYMCVSGSLSIEHKSNIYNLKTGETVLLPAVIKQVKIKSKDAKVLEIVI